MKRLFLLVGFGIAGIACGDPAWVGTYQTTGHWNLSGPLSDGRSAGDAIADMLIDQVAAATPLPGGTADDLAVALDELVRPKIRELIDERAPPEVRSDGSLTMLLASSLANVQVETTLTLEEGGDDVEGEEIFDAFQIGTHRFTAAELGASEIRAEWNGEEEDDHFELEPHEVGLNYGALVKIAARQAIDQANLEQLEGDILATIECSALVAKVLDGKSELEIDLGLVSTSISAGTLTDGCNTLRGLVAESALGLFAVGSPVEIGGKVTYTETDDGRAELRHGEGFGGLLKVVPDPIAPKIWVAFEAKPTGE
jgi:hypothetical protein